MVSLLEEGENVKAQQLLIESPFVDESQIQFLIGNIYLQENSIDKAKESYIKSFNKAPYSKPLKNLIMIFVTKGQYSEATPLLEKYIELAEKDPTFAPSAQDYLMMGVCYMQVNDYKRAEYQFIQSLALDSEAKDTRLNLFQLYMNIENFAKAEGQIKQLIAKSPEPNANYHKYYANLAIGLGKKKLALEQLEKSLKIDPSNEANVEMIKRIKSDLDSKKGHSSKK